MAVGRASRVRFLGGTVGSNIFLLGCGGVVVVVVVWKLKGGAWVRGEYEGEGEVSRGGVSSGFQVKLGCGMESVSGGLSGREHGKDKL